MTNTQIRNLLLTLVAGAGCYVGLEPSQDLAFQSKELGCPLTQGFWKNHNAYAAGAQHLHWPLPETTMLCGKTWYDILWTAPSGDAWFILAHQYIAASLNVASGAEASSDVLAALADAESFLSDCVVTADERDDALAASDLLDRFNNGDSTLGACGEPPTGTESTTGEESSGGLGTDTSGADTSTGGDSASEESSVGDSESDSTGGEAESSGGSGATSTSGDEGGHDDGGQDDCHTTADEGGGDEGSATSGGDGGDDGPIPQIDPWFTYRESTKPPIPQ